MKNSKYETLSLKFSDSKIEILDQTRLPFENHWIDITEPNLCVSAIKELKVRGAPLIGVVAAINLGIFCLHTENKKLRLHWLNELITSRPTAVNLIHLLTEMKSMIESDFISSDIFKKSVDFFHQDQAMCEKISLVGAKRLKLDFLDLKTSKIFSILTHCNTGALATAGVGTALGVIKKVNEDLALKVYVDETRPLLQGARLTAWELEKENINFELICDNMAGFLMLQNKVDAVIVGADRITAHGDVANKIGTYTLAVLCHHHKIPFYVAAPTTTIDSAIDFGSDIPIEQRSASEVRGFEALNAFWAKDSFKVYNPSFDWVPSKLITGWITEDKCYDQKDIESGLFKKYQKADH